MLAAFLAVNALLRTESDIRAQAITATFLGRCRCCAMVQPHPHAGATYKVIAREGAFEVEVTVPMTATRVTITGLQTQADAERWIDRHQAAIAAGSPDSRAPSFKSAEPK